MTPDTMQQLGAETRRERLHEAESARLAARFRTRRRSSFARRFAEALGHLLSGHRQPVVR